MRTKRFFYKVEIKFGEYSRDTISGKSCSVIYRIKSNNNIMETKEK